MNTPTGEVFRTDCASGTNTHWRLLRGGTEHGHLYSGASGSNFNIQQSINDASLWLRNYTDNGIRLIDDQAFLNNLNGYTGLTHLGYVAIGVENEMNPTSVTRMPWARLHLVQGQNSNISYGFRPWMRNGVIMTGNDQQMYMGHMWDASGVNHAVMQIANTGTLGANRQTIRFIHTTTPSSTGSSSLGGMEFMRLWPESYSEPYVGIGDFNGAGTNPLDRLDVLNGNVRIRALPGTSATSDTKVVVVDANGVLHWKYDTSVGASDCEWTMSSSAPNHVYTAVGGSSASCPDDAEAVGIGVAPSSPTYKLGVETDDFATAINVVSGMSSGTTTGLGVTASGGSALTRGISVTSTQASNTAENRGISIAAAGAGSGGSATNYGLRADLSGASYRTRGVSAATTGASWTAYGGEFLAYDAASYTTGCLGEAYGGTDRYGVNGQAYAGTAGGGSWGSANIVTGVAGRADCGGSGTYGYGVYGEAANCTNTWAGYFNGDVQIQGDLWNGGTMIFSDENLKTNIAEVDGALALGMLQQLQPRSYSYNVAQYPHMHFQEGAQFGFLAQEMQNVVPQLVSSTVVPARIDSTGQVLNEELATTGINYTGLVPLLVAAMQEQQAAIAALQQQVVGLQDQVNGCCNGGMAPGGEDARSTGYGGNDGTIMGNARALSIQPNPFSEPPTIQYTLERAGRMQLIANSADGKQLSVLREAAQEAGEYQLVWDTTTLQPGMYYFTLLLDGEPVVKKAVKAGR